MTQYDNWLALKSAVRKSILYHYGDPELALYWNWFLALDELNLGCWISKDEDEEVSRIVVEEPIKLKRR